MQTRIAIFLLLLTVNAFAAATRVVTTPQGTHTEEFAGFNGPVRRATLDDPQILWSRNLATGIFNSVSVADSLYAFTGSGLNDPREAARYELDGIGEPAYAALGTEWEVATTQSGEYWAAVDRDAQNDNILYFYNSAVDTPLWSLHLGTGYVGGTRGLQFSRDGSTLGLFFGQLNNQPPWIYGWNVADQDSSPYFGFVVEEGNGISARALALSSDGSVFAATADNYLHIIDRETGVPRDIVNIGASTDGLALSPDGNFALTGFTDVRCWRWNGTNYVMRWQSGMNPRYVSQLLISPDTTYAVACGYPPQYNRNYIRVYDLTTGQVLWNYAYNLDTGSYQDWPIDADISEDGNWFAVGSWGSEGNENGEAVVFSRYHAHPYYELDLPGSCFALDLSGNGKYLIAAGKHVHANQFGNGGDVTIVDLDLPPAEPLPQLAFPELILDSVLTMCTDTLRFRLGMINAGYAPMTIDSLSFQSGFGSRDESYVRFDSALVTSEITPGDTLWIPVVLFSCAHDTLAGWYTHVFRFDVEGLSMGFGLIAQYVLPSAADPSMAPAPLGFVLDSVFPNPFNPATTLSFTLPAATDVSIRIFDVTGRLVDSAQLSAVPAGQQHYRFAADDLPSGLYISSITTRFGALNSKLFLLK